MSRTLVLIGGIAAFFAIAAMCLMRSPAAIEEDIRQRATQQFDDADLRWARVGVDGRDLRLSGLAPDAAARDRAASIAAGLVGVRTVSNRMLTIDERVAEQLQAATDATGRVAVPAAEDARGVTEGMDEFDRPFADLPYGLRMKRAGDTLELEGAMPDQRLIDTLVSLAQQRFADDAVDVAVVVRPGAPPNWLQAASASLALLEQLNPGQIAIADQSITIVGVAPSEAVAEQLRSRAGNRLPPGYVGSTELSVGGDLETLLRTSPDLARRLDNNAATAAPRAPATQPDPVFADEAAPAGAQSSNAPTAPPDGVASDPALQQLSPAACQRHINEIVAQRSIRFEVASDVIDSVSRTQLDDIAAIARRCVNARLEVAGHTDDQGTEANNLSLSQRRAESVMAYLVGQGVRLNRLSARGYGEARPLVPNETADARAINRRIEFSVEERYQ